MKRAQVTLFIILGIVILAVVAFLLYLNGILTEANLKKLTEKTQAVPLQAQPVKQYITSCVEETAKEGITLLGLQGGYINPPEDPLPRSIINPFSSSLEFFSGYEVPYWFYESSNGIQKTQIPTLQNMEQDLEIYMNEQLPHCLFNLSLFDEYSIEFKDDIESDVTIKSDWVKVDVNYPVLISIEGITTQLERHSATIDVPLGKLSVMANDILKKENEEYFLEKVTEDALVLYDNIPYHGESFDCQPKTWLKQDIEKQLKEIISMNINAVKIADTKNSDVDPYFLVRLSAPSYRDIETSFTYLPEWPFQLEINGGEEILKEDSATGSAALLMNLLCINTHNFIYDIKYPVLISLYDENSLDGFTFQFATQAILDNNQPRENRLGTEDIAATNKRVCESADMPMRIYAIDEETGASLNHASIGFSCAGTFCDLGETDVVSVDDYALDVKMPQCLNGIININREGYGQSNLIIDTLESADVFVSLKPVYTKTLVLKAIENGRIRDLREDERAILEFSNEEDQYSITATDKNKEIGLIEGNYFIRSYITRDKNIMLEDKDVEYCTDIPRKGILGIFGSTKKKCFTTTIEGTTLDSVLIGGAEFSFSFDDLQKGEEIIIYNIVEDTPINIPELEELYESIQQNDQREEFRYPELV